MATGRERTRPDRCHGLDVSQADRGSAVEPSNLEISGCRSFQKVPETAEIAIRYARKIPRRQLVEGLRALYDADSSVKGGSPDDRAVMEFVLARLTGSSDKAGDQSDRVKAGNST